MHPLAKICVYIDALLFLLLDLSLIWEKNNVENHEIVQIQVMIEFIVLDF
jgi:hypothetical protein